jgi:hypothetical protein
MAAEDLPGKAPGQEDITEEHSFDALAKGLASHSLSRRAALKWVGRAVLGGLLAFIPGVAWAHHKPGHGVPPGQGGTPPGQGGTPPGQGTTTTTSTTTTVAPPTTTSTTTTLAPPPTTTSTTTTLAPPPTTTSTTTTCPPAQTCGRLCCEPGGRCCGAVCLTAAEVAQGFTCCGPFRCEPGNVCCPLSDDCIPPENAGTPAGYTCCGQQTCIPGELCCDPIAPGFPNFCSATC